MKYDTCVLVCRAMLSAVLVLMIGSTAAAQTERILHSFTGGSDGLFPESGMIFDGKGNLYGTTAGGGANGGCSGCGTVFKLSPTASGAWTETILYGFGASFGDGIDSLSSLTFDGKGNLYGTTITGGGQQEGTVFELSPSLGGTWTEKILINFTGGTDGGQPVGGLVFDSVGNLYGVTSVGGLHGFGTVFRLTPGAGGTWTEQVLHSFAGGNDGATPTFGNTLIPDGAGNLYGVASQGGLHDYGVVFELVRASGWAEKVLYAFPGGSGGSFPEGSLVFDHAGNLYGSASYTVFELSPTSSGFWTEKTLHSFVGGSDGASAAAGLIFDKAGNLYGTTGTGGAHRGIVFELTPTTAGTWTEKILHRFSATGGDGTFPGFGTLTIDSTGHLYGTTTSGGSSNDGVVFQVTP